jgi:hypothetical protein
MERWRMLALIGLGVFFAPLSCWLFQDLAPSGDAPDAAGDLGGTVDGGAEAGFGRDARFCMGVDANFCEDFDEPDATWWNRTAADDGSTIVDDTTWQSPPASLLARCSVTQSQPPGALGLTQNINVSSEITFAFDVLATVENGSSSDGVNIVTLGEEGVATVYLSAGTDSLTYLYEQFGNQYPRHAALSNDLAHKWHHIELDVRISDAGSGSSYSLRVDGQIQQEDVLYGPWRAPGAFFFRWPFTYYVGTIRMNFDNFVVSAH